MNIQRIVRMTVLSVIMLSFASCRPLLLNFIEPEGPAEYQLGWQDGCDTGMSADSPVFYKMMYGFKKRPEMGANDLYKQGWNEGFTYCRFSHGVTDKSWFGGSGAYSGF